MNSLFGSGVGAFFGRRVVLSLLPPIIVLVGVNLGVDPEFIWMAIAGPIGGVIGISAEDWAKAWKKNVRKVDAPDVARPSLLSEQRLLNLPPRAALARKLYEEYVAAGPGTSYNGDPLPTWDKILEKAKADLSSKECQVVLSWEAAAQYALDLYV